MYLVEPEDSRVCDCSQTRLHLQVMSQVAGFCAVQVTVSLGQLYGDVLYFATTYLEGAAGV